MIDTKYNPIPTKLCSNYFVILINRFYKILPLKEEASPTITQYITSLLSEMTGNKELIDLLQNDGQYLSLLGSLEYLMLCDNVKTCKREIFKCIRIIEELNRKYFGGD